VLSVRPVMEGVVVTLSTNVVAVPAFNVSSRLLGLAKPTRVDDEYVHSPMNAISMSSKRVSDGAVISMCPETVSIVE
jgi:hypothetical protein